MLFNQTEDQATKLECGIEELILVQNKFPRIWFSMNLDILNGRESVQTQNNVRFKNIQIQGISTNKA